MTRWHNGPNGPGVCRAKSGNCPFGGEESHFDSREEAEKVYNEQSANEFGILPEMNKEDSTNEKETKIVAYSSSGVALSKSNFVNSNGKGSKDNEEYITNKLKDANMDSKKMVDSLNEDENIHGEWKLKNETDSKITLENKDVFGNISYVDVRKVEPKAKGPKPGGITAVSSNGQTPLNLANYVSNDSGGDKESQEYFKNKIKKANYDSAKIVRFLNADKRIHGKWSLDSEDDNTIRLKNEDAFGNDSYISIEKE